MGYIYKIVNKVNKKIYIGQTTSTLEERLKEHIDEAERGNKSNSLLHKAIIKYGSSNFEIEQIEEIPDCLLNNREKYWIEYYDSFYPKNPLGYNLTLGGEGALKYKDEDILSLWQQGYKIVEISNILNANQNTIISRIKGLGYNPRENYSKSLCRPVIQISLEGEIIQYWESIINAAETLKLDSGAITKCCQHLRSKAGDFLWKYADDTIEIEQLMENYAKSLQCHKVNLINEKGEIIKIFSSGAEAEKELGISRGKVSEVCNHKRGRKTANGYRFEWNYPLKRKLVDG